MEKLLARWFLRLSGWQAEGVKPAREPLRADRRAPHLELGSGLPAGLRRRLRRAHLVDGQGRALPASVRLADAPHRRHPDRPPPARRHGRAGRAHADERGASSCSSSPPKVHAATSATGSPASTTSRAPRTSRSCSATSTTPAAAAASAPRSKPPATSRADMDKIRAFYADKVATLPGPVRRRAAEGRGGGE